MLQSWFFGIAMILIENVKNVILRLLLVKTFAQNCSRKKNFHFNYKTIIIVIIIQ
jgi:hypothetical protein